MKIRFKYNKYTFNYTARHTLWCSEGVQDVFRDLTGWHCNRRDFTLDVRSYPFDYSVQIAWNGDFRQWYYTDKKYANQFPMTTQSQDDITDKLFNSADILWIAVVPRSAL